MKSLNQQKKDLLFVLYIVPQKDMYRTINRSKVYSSLMLDLLKFLRMVEHFSDLGKSNKT